ncbi:hypothetical protein D3C81_1639680 [compost metagenome]
MCSYGKSGLAGGNQPTLQLIGEQEIRQLALSIAERWLVIPFQVQVIKVDDSRPMRNTAYGHDACTRRRAEQIQQQAGQRKMP